MPVGYSPRPLVVAPAGGLVLPAERHPSVQQPRCAPAPRVVCVPSASSSATARLFLGSSAEGRQVARNLESELGDICEVVRWDRDVFEPSGNALDSLLATAAEVDFAVLVATPDDKTVSRGAATPSARDNIVLEFGLFAGALGRNRTYLLATDELKLPTDVLGLTRLRYRLQSNGNHRAAVNDAALQIEERVRRLGPLERGRKTGGSRSESDALAREIDILCASATAQGWTVRTNSATTLRLRTTRGRNFTLPKGQPGLTRVELRPFAAQLRAAGLRVNSSVRRPVGESPF
jgi:predicted nucleotide-binding protein